MKLSTARKAMAATAAGAAALLISMPASAAKPGPSTSTSGSSQGAAYTTFLKGQSAHCVGGSPNGINCNIYDDKNAVYINGGPTSNVLADGSYFFAVVAPGAQHKFLIDGTGLLSSDTVADRTFSVSAGVISYSGSHLTGMGPTKTPVIQLMPYADTPNPGGVYILAICKTGATTPKDCKYDAYKIQTSGGAQVNSVFSGDKFRDDVTNGYLDPSEATTAGLSGWNIRIYKNGVYQATVTTITDGSWTWTSPSAAPGTGTDTYVFCEVAKSGWSQTGPGLLDTGGVDTAGVTLTGPSASSAAVSTGSNPVDSSDTSTCYSISAPQSGLDTAGSVDFFNIPQGSISGEKYYDSNSNGSLTSGELGIASWKIDIYTWDGTTATYLKTVTTDSTGAWSTTLAPGTYRVREEQALGGWTQTGNTTDQSSTTYAGSASSFGATLDTTTKVYTVVVPSDLPETVSGLYFGNVCQVSPGPGHTLGWWKNNGNASVTGAELTLLNTYNLRNADGSKHTFTSQSDLATWLNGANGSNMAYMLSAQLATMILDVDQGYTFGNVLIDGSRSVNDEIAYANNLLANPITISPFVGQNGSVTIASSALRTEQARVEQIIDNTNNGQTSTQTDGSACNSGGTPVFPS